MNDMLLTVFAPGESPVMSAAVWGVASGMVAVAMTPIFLPRDHKQERDLVARGRRATAAIMAAALLAGPIIETLPLIAIVYFLDTEYATLASLLTAVIFGLLHVPHRNFRISRENIFRFSHSSIGFFIFAMLTFAFTKNLGFLSAFLLVSLSHGIANLCAIIAIIPFAKLWFKVPLEAQPNG